MHQILRNTLICLCAAFILVGSLSADNWHQWRGPNNDGISQATEAPTHWSQTENVQWRLPLPGEAGSTPVVWEDKIFPHFSGRGCPCFDVRQHRRRRTLEKDDCTR